ncbi:MAG TPA: DUF1573 domain-containing protein [Patescibacteria group bacterium]|nr:DUF1573 domain-containing protein [Patescibacteria group bacterium]
MNKKILVILIAMFALVGGAVFLFAGDKQSSDASLAKVEAQEVSVTPESYDIGRVLMKDGIVTREYEIKNSSSNTLRIKNIATSCMCTRAQVILGDKRTRLYSMEMSGAKNPNVDFDIPGGQSAKLVVKFDPAAHGPAGVGKVDRVVSLTFLDPVGTRQVAFSGEVVLQ